MLNASPSSSIECFAESRQPNEQTLLVIWSRSSGPRTGNHSQTIQPIAQMPVTNRKSFLRTFPSSKGVKWGARIMSREAVLENVRRFRTIASLYRQTAAFRPSQSCSLLGQAKDWEYRALAELESYFKGPAQLEIAIAA